jgi:glycosyltransferase involved in cell wall biosynthesis
VRVALIGPVPPDLGGATPGGVATHQVHLAAGLAAAGVDAPLLATNTQHGSGWPARSGDAPFPLYRVGHGWTGADRMAPYAVRLGLQRPRGSRREILRNLLWYRRFLSEVRPDVIHVQHPLERCLYVQIVRRFEGWTVPLVVTAHSLFGEHADDTIRELMAPNLRAADRVIAVSEHVADQAVDLGVQRNRVRVIRSGVDTERFRPRDRLRARERLNVAEATPLVLFVGNLEPRKQVDVLVRAIARVRRHLSLPPVELLVVGSGESAGIEDQTARLRQLTADLGLGDSVRFLGRVDESRLQDCYAAADVFALASSSEAQGIVALEAMACGLPVVSTAVGGLLATIADGETGFLVPPGDADSLAERLLELLTDARRRQAMGAAARGAVARNFAWPRAIDDTVAVYREVVACR